VQVLESHQASKMDPSGTAKDVIACFEKLGVTYDMNRVRFIFYPQAFFKINCPINKIAI
jgi:4-hydroxy-tetrahydrodipicolinate reductase